MMKPLAGRAGPESAGAESDQVPWHGGGPGGPPGRTRRLAGPAQARRAARRRAGQLMNKDATLKECNKHNKTIKEDKINTIKEE